MSRSNARTRWKSCLYLFVCFVGLGTILATLRNFNGQITYLFYPLYLLVKKPCKMNLKTNFWTLSMAPPSPNYNIWMHFKTCLTSKIVQRLLEISKVYCNFQKIDFASWKLENITQTLFSIYSSCNLKLYYIILKGNHF